MRKFEYDEIDIKGKETLLSFSQANRFNKWMYDSIAPYCKGNTLEIGSGIGNITQFFLRDKKKITASDIRENYRKNIVEKYGKHDVKVINIDIVNPNFDIEYKEYLGSFDTVFSLNVIEHIEDDSKAVKNCYKLLKNEGSLIILVPSHEYLYNRIDKGLMHFRRYTKAKLKKLFVDTHLQIIHSQYFNFVGMFAWLISGIISKKNYISSGEMKLYNRLVPIFKFIDLCTFKKAGLSIIMVGKK